MKTCETCGLSFNVRGFGRHTQACCAKSPTTDTVVDTDSESGEHGALHLSQPLTTQSDIHITDDWAQDEEVVGDLGEVDGAFRSGESIEAGGSSK